MTSIDSGTLVRSIRLAGEELASDETTGGFLAKVGVPSMRGQTPDVEPVHKGRWELRKSVQSALSTDEDEKRHDAAANTVSASNNTTSAARAAAGRGVEARGKEDTLQENNTDQRFEFKIWISAFIPRNVHGSRRISEPSYKKYTMFPFDVPIGRWIDKFGRRIGEEIGSPDITIPLGTRYFITDNREFSDQFNASYRVRSAVEAFRILKCNSSGYTFQHGEQKTSKKFGTSIEFDSKGHYIQEGKHTDKEDNKVLPMFKNVDNLLFRHHLDDKSSNSLVLPSVFGPIQFEVNIAEIWDIKSGKVLFSLSGMVGDFPAFEGYVTFGGETKKLFYKDAFHPKDILINPSGEKLLISEIRLPIEALPLLGKLPNFLKLAYWKHFYSRNFDFVVGPTRSVSGSAEFSIPLCSYPHGTF